MRVGLLCIVGVSSLLLPCFASAEALTLARTEILWRLANIDLRLSKHAISATVGDVSTADRRENPNLILGATSLSSRAGLGSGNLRSKNADSVLRVEQLVERGDKRTFRTRAAEARLAAARFDAEETERTGLIQLSQAYWDLKLAFEREHLAHATTQLASEAVVAADKRLKVGDISVVDVSKLRVDKLRSENDARVARADRQKSQLAIAILIGRGDDAENLSCADDWPPVIEVPTASADLAARLENRADIRAANARIAAAEAAVETARSLGKRDVTVGVQFEHYPSVGDQSPNNTWGLSVGIPLFASHRYEGELIRAKSELDQARDQADRTRALARADAMRIANEFRASKERLDSLESTLQPEAEKVTAAAEFAYRKGATGLLELLDARRTLRQIQQEAAMAKSDYAKALVAMRLQIASGTSK
ncbi:MAG: TolC family protein [Betaproteobacteria bacterium]